MMLGNQNDFRVVGDDFYHRHAIVWPRRLRRRHLFLLLFFPFLLISESVIFLQQAIFESQALVLTTAASNIDQAHDDADLEHVNIQKQVLLGQPVLEKTAEILSKPKNATSLTVNELKTLFDVRPIANTNLVQLIAQGSDPLFLQKALDTWIKSYQHIRADYIIDITEKASVSINGELARLEQQVREQRSAMETFRLQHDIVSVDSTDNEAHARLQGLNNALNTALEEEAKAQAKLDSIRAAIAEGKAVVAESDSQSLAMLVQKAEQIRDRLEAQRSQYTDEYIDFHPTLRNLKAQLAELDEKIAGKQQIGSRFAIQEAETEYGAARRTVLTLQKQMAEHKQKATDYTTHFATHKAMQEELLKLEKLLQETKQRLIEIDVKQRQSNPQLDVVDWATLPDKPVRPDYWQEAALAFAGSLVLALLSIVINDYLNKEPQLATIDSITEIQLYHHPEQRLDRDESTELLDSNSVNRLQTPDNPKHLSDDTPEP